MATNDGVFAGTEMGSAQSAPDVLSAKNGSVHRSDPAQPGRDPNVSPVGDERDIASTETPREKGHRWFAAIYDRMGRSEEREFLGQMRHHLLSGVQGNVLEIGAGTGANFAHYPSGARVIALEPDPFMLKRAEQKVAELGLSNVSLQRAPAESLPFPDASFDTVVSTLVLCTVQDVASCLAEMRRVLRPGGRVLFIEHVRAQGWFGGLQDLVRPVWSWFGAGCQPNRRTDDAFRHAGWEVTIDERHAFRFVPMLRGCATHR
jgi:SAM-dependent methyltransferase